MFNLKYLKALDRDLKYFFPICIMNSSFNFYHCVKKSLIVFWKVIGSQANDLVYIVLYDG